MGHKLEDRVKESNQAEKQKVKRVIKTGNRLRKLSNIIKHSNICIIGIPEGEERKGSRKFY